LRETVSLGTGAAAYSDIIAVEASQQEHNLFEMKPRLFSTLRSLQHENPLVRFIQ